MTDFSSTENLTIINNNNIPSDIWLDTSSILPKFNNIEQEKINNSIKLQNQLFLMENQLNNNNNLQQNKTSLISLPSGLNNNILFSEILSSNNYGNILINKREEEEEEENRIIFPSLNSQPKTLENKLEEEFKLQSEQQLLLNKFQMSMAPTGPCAFCHLPIIEKHFLLVDSQCFHLNCVRCSVCSRNLENFKNEGEEENKNICFAKDGFLFCRRDYLLKYGKKCERCVLPIEKGNLVMKVPLNGNEILFHIQCFVCICCGRPLQPGEQYMIGGPFDEPGGSLFCSDHFHLNPAIHRPSKFISDFQSLNCRTEEPNYLNENNLIYSGLLKTTQIILENSSSSSSNQKLNIINLRPPLSNNNEFIIDYDNNYESTTINRTFNNNTSSVCGSITPNSCGGTQSEDLTFGGSNTNLSENGDVLSSSNKLKRMRTSFKHTQLRTMKAYFFINHNPDSKDLKILSNKTGLTKRVLQVWFQNARAKYRRSQMGGCSSSINLLENQRIVTDNCNNQQLINLSIENNNNNILINNNEQQIMNNNNQQQQLGISSSSSNNNNNITSPINSSSTDSVTISLNACSIDEQNNISDNSLI